MTINTLHSLCTLNNAIHAWIQVRNAHKGIPWSTLQETCVWLFATPSVLVEIVNITLIVKDKKAIVNLIERKFKNVEVNAV